MQHDLTIQDYFEVYDKISGNLNDVNFHNLKSQLNGINGYLFSLFEIWESHQTDGFKWKVNTS